ncbi:hypothetical protein A2U01_0011305, partial [Trifolium medium]|nr:hypothetical protein [Trifolium medium]
KRHDEEEPQCHRVEVIEAIEEKLAVQTPLPPLERGLVDSMEAQEAEWNREIEIFLQRLEDDLEEAPKKPIVISSVLTPLEEEELVKEAKTVNDSLEGDLNGMIPIYCLHTPKKDKDLNPVVQPQEVPTPTLGDLVEKEVMKLFKTGMIKCMPESLRVNPVDVTSKEKGFKESPKRSIKKKKFKWKIKGENPKSDPAGENSWRVDRKVAPLKKVQKKERQMTRRSSTGNYADLCIHCGKTVSFPQISHIYLFSTYLHEILIFPHSRFKSGPVNNRGNNGGEGENEEEGEDQGMRDVMEEIDRFDGGAIPTQTQQGSGSGWPYSNSEHELASLLHNLDINSHFRM